MKTWQHSSWLRTNLLQVIKNEKVEGNDYNQGINDVLSVQPSSRLWIYSQGRLYVTHIWAKLHASPSLVRKIRDWGDVKWCTEALEAGSCGEVVEAAVISCSINGPRQTWQPRSRRTNSVWSHWDADCCLLGFLAEIVFTSGGQVQTPLGLLHQWELDS